MLVTPTNKSVFAGLEGWLLLRENLVLYKDELRVRNSLQNISDTLVPVLSKFLAQPSPEQEL